MNWLGGRARLLLHCQHSPAWGSPAADDVLPSHAEALLVRIPVTDLKPGMILTDDLVGKDGRLLLPGGCVLDEKILDRLRNWGVYDVEVEGEAPAAGAFVSLPEDIDPNIARRSRKLVSPFFVLCGADHPGGGRTLPPGRARHGRPGCPRGAVLHYLQPDSLEEQAPLVPFDDDTVEVASLQGILERDTSLSSFPDVYFRILHALENPQSSARGPGRGHRQGRRSFGQVAPAGQQPFLRVRLQGGNHHPGRCPWWAPTNSSPWPWDCPCSITSSTFPAAWSAWKISGACPWPEACSPGFWPGYRTAASAERCFIGGLLRDIGRLIMYRHMPRTMTRVMAAAQAGPQDLTDAEKRDFGLRPHPPWAGCCSGSGALPPPLVEMVRFHHAPEKAVGSLEPAVVHLADLMAAVWGHRANRLWNRSPAVSEAAWDILGLSPQSPGLGLFAGPGTDGRDF